MLKRITEVKDILQKSVDIPEHKRTIFYKTQPGQYAAHDQFMGVKNPKLRAIAKKFYDLTLSELQLLIESPYNEERLLSLFILIKQYQSSKINTKQNIYSFYLKNMHHVNNWNLVDASAHYIIGAHLANDSKAPLFTLAESSNMWERRIAIVSTWYFIRLGDVDHTILLAKKLLNDKHDLMHKAVGWMLREVGKKNLATLIQFLDKHAALMPRTMLRYAIERLTADERSHYMKH